MFRLLNRTASALSTIGDVFGALSRKRRRRFLILLPVLLFVAIAIAVITSSGALAPFVYPLF
jgi:hypothetical protein